MGKEVVIKSLKAKIKNINEKIKAAKDGKLKEQLESVKITLIRNLNILDKGNK